ncbi:IQ and ubiquitin-like domain-containing protein [Lates japonicus]|uniref:IQ and ubiquitin-like domain-containing protein n=1 Tax=Lates japonicus TaxID=270547 RepID=A0AAD3MUF6_LATJO|nr:IQ and ubiquitin-like domain-containing protein [Lates japonicus]
MIKTAQCLKDRSEGGAGAGGSCDDGGVRHRSQRHQELKSHLASELRAPVEVLQVSLDSRVVEERQSLMELGVRPHGSIRMEMSSTDPTTHPLRPLRPPEHDNMPDVITVRVPAGDGESGEVVVRSSAPPPEGLCGAATPAGRGRALTHARPGPDPAQRRPDRGSHLETKTVEQKSQAQQCPVNVSTQMTGIGCYVSCINDNLVAPGNYITADECHDRRLRAVICLQSYARRCLARQEVERLRRKAALCLLLEQEAQLIATIGRHRIAVHNNNYDKTIRKFLDKCGAPHQWRAADGRLIEMDTQHTIRARELRDLYAGVNELTAAEEQRLHVLMTLKHTVKEHECQLTRDIVDLIDREVDLMTRGVKAVRLEGLRRRICTLFLQYIKTPAFNPEVAKLLKVPQNPSKLRSDMFLCRSCHRYLRSSDFSSAASARLSTRCLDCAGLDNIARSRDEFSCYKNILKRLRADEQQLNEDAKIPFLLQVEDVRYLVRVVWASHSALNASTDLYNLVFVRWERKRDWSPWNCILLSKEETSAHMEVQDVHKAYEATFVRRIEHKHMLARRHFSQIPVMAECLDSQPTAALGNQLVSKPVTMTAKHAADTTPASAR